MGIPAFVAEFGAKAARARDRVLLQTMYLFPSHFSDLLTHSLEAAAKRGLTSALSTDGIVGPLRERDRVITKITGGETDRSVDLSATRMMLDRLASAGVRQIESRPFTPINRMIFAYKRNHFKMAVVDDEAWIGGLNAGKQLDYSRIDFMMRLTDKPLVDEIADLILNPEKVKNDYTKKFGEVDMIVDAGEPGKSAIIDRTIKEIEAIQNPTDSEVTILTPWVPDGKLLDVLHAAQGRGVRVTVLTSHHKFQLAFEGIYAVVKNLNKMMMDLKGKRIPLRYTPLEVHGKMLSIRDGDRRMTMVTTNNFTEKGVKMGTTEIGLISSNPDFTRSCDDFLIKVRAVATEKIPE